MNLFTSELFAPARHSVPDRRAAFGAAPAYGRRYGWRRAVPQSAAVPAPALPVGMLGRFVTAAARRRYDYAA